MAKKVIELNPNQNESVPVNEPLTPEQQQAKFFEELKAFEGMDTSNLPLVDGNGHKIVFVNDDEAMIYGAEYQRQHDEVLGFELVQGYSGHIGRFVMIEPIIRDNEDQALDFVSPDILKGVFANTLKKKREIEDNLEALTNHKK